MDFVELTAAIYKDWDFLLMSQDQSPVVVIVQYVDA